VSLSVSVDDLFCLASWRFEKNPADTDISASGGSSAAEGIVREEYAIKDVYQAQSLVQTA
jgi:hypothetical protein